MMHKKKSAKTYIYGLSLDVTDKDLIVEIFDYSSKVYIYYRSQSSYEKMIVNLIDVLGKERVVKSMHDNTISFVGIAE